MIDGYARSLLMLCCLIVIVTGLLCHVWFTCTNRCNEQLASSNRCSYSQSVSSAFFVIDYSIQVMSRNISQSSILNQQMFRKKQLKTSWFRFSCSTINLLFEIANVIFKLNHRCPAGFFLRATPHDGRCCSLASSLGHKNVLTAEHLRL